MTTLVFLLGIATLFALVFFLENKAAQVPLVLRPAGLVSWLVGGNWPAKVGALLLIIGTGALLRYVMANVDVPPNLKVFSGVVIATSLALASGALRNRPQRRSIYLALGGAALGVAYLTAYSAFSFFHYMGEFEALAMLFIVACCSTVFAVSARSLSMALLAMVGAFIAPAFALTSPGPLSVYGYYIVASLLVLYMVWLRGWRPLIHLSFLFTLAGGLFFGWTHAFYTSAYYSQMQPLLLLSVGLHLAMPFVESAQSMRRVPTNRWLQRFDLSYFLLLPLVAVVLTLAIAPNVHQQGVAGLLGMAGLWVLGGAGQHLRFRQGALRFIGIAFVFVLLAAMLALDNVPYFLISAVAACALLCLGRKLGVPDQVDGLLSSVALASSAGYLLAALTQPVTGTPLVNATFMLHTLLAVSLAVAGLRMRQRGAHLAPVLLMLAASWFFVALARELIQLKLAHISQLVHVGVVLGTLAYTYASRRAGPSLGFTLTLAGAVFFTGWTAASGLAPQWILPFGLAGQIAFSLLAAFAGRHKDQGEMVAGVARSILPLILLPWAWAYNEHLPIPQVQTVMTLLAASALFASVQGQWLLPRGRTWPNILSPVGFILFAFWLLYQTLFHIEREMWAIAYEMLTLVYLYQTLLFVPASNEEDARFFKVVAALCTLSVALAMVLRMFGPPGVLTILDLNNILLPAVLSLCLAGVSGITAWWSQRLQSRALWIAATVGLAASAAKLVFLDFGSLGQLGNILGMMGAGVVFLLVAWLAPIPPKAPSPTPPERDSPEDEPDDLTDTQPMMWDNPKVVPVARATEAPAAVPRAQRRPARVRTEVIEEPRSRGWIWLLIGLAVVALVHHRHQVRTAKRAAYAAEQAAYAAEQQALASRVELMTTYPAAPDVANKHPQAAQVATPNLQE